MTAHMFPILQKEVLELPPAGWGNFLDRVKDDWDKKAKEMGTEELVNVEKRLNKELERVKTVLYEIQMKEEALEQLLKSPEALMNFVIAWNGTVETRSAIIEDYVDTYRFIKARLVELRRRRDELKREHAFYFTIRYIVRSELERRAEE